MTLEAELLTNPRAMKENLAEHARLLEGSSDGSLFLRTEWQEAWWKHFGEGRQLQIIRVREKGRLIGHGSFMISGLGRFVRMRKLEFVGAGHSDQLGILAEADREDVIDLILDRLIDDSNWDIGEFRDVHEGGPTAKCVLAKFPTNEIAKENSPCISVRPDFEQYLSSLSQNARHNIVRARQKNAELNTKFVRITDASLMKGALEEFFRLHDMRWSDKEDTSVLTPAMRDFLRDAVIRLAIPGISVIHALKAGDKTISMILGFEFRNRYLYYLSGFDPSYMKQSPGRFLLSMIIEEAHRRKLQEVDLLRGEEQYKYHLGAENRTNIIVRIRKPSMKARIMEKII